MTSGQDRHGEVSEDLAGLLGRCAAGDEAAWRSLVSAYSRRVFALAKSRCRKVDVAEEITEPALQISLEEGRKLDPDCQIGDSLGTKMDTTTFGRIAAQSAKQVIIQKIKDAEKDAVYESFIDRKGEIINGIVQRIDRRDIIVNLGHTEGVVPALEQVPRESYRRGDRIRALILDVLHESRGPQVILTRTHPDFLVSLFKTEVPEISEGVVKIMAASREPGVRAKIAVS